MKVAVTKVTPHREGLYLGLVIKHEKAGWVRFATTVLVVDDLSPLERRMILHALSKSRDQVLDTEVEVPLF